LPVGEVQFVLPVAGGVGVGSEKVTVVVFVTVAV
jgi:hypothetical protein